MPHYRHIERALREIGREIQSVWAERVKVRTGKYRRAIENRENVQVTPRTVSVGNYARKRVFYAQFVEDGHRAFALPRRIQSWDVSSSGKPYKRLAFVPKGGTERIVRTITPNSKGWRIPAMEGQHNAEEVPRLIRPQIVKRLKEAAKKDCIDLLRKEINTTLGEGRFVKIKVAI